MSAEHPDTAGAAVAVSAVSAEESPTLLHLQGVSKSYGDKPILSGVDLEVKQGEYVTVLGPSGSGKTVLLRLVAGFEEPDEGRVLINGVDMAGVPAHRRNVGVVFQGFALFPHLKVGQNIGFGLRNRVHDRLSKEEADAKVDAMLELVGLVGLKDRRVNQISGGQKQRVALARSLASDPTLVLLDEPLGALDANLRASMKVELKNLQQRIGATFIHVTGNEEEALAMADRIMVLERGQVAQFDSPDQVFAQPKTARVAFALSRFNLITGVVEDTFTGKGFDLCLPPSSGITRGPATYCIGYDRVEVVDIGTPLPEGFCSVVARHVSHEYSGAIVTYLFELPDGQHFEAQYHLHHRKAQRLSEGQDYQLMWPINAGSIYPEEEE